ncbi:MAG: DUF882 domain-containing protein [Deltaproteobacteria bacterium]|nr:DUF882 domain-containing protein [Deltaproteobacteria bacterium]
MRIRILCLRAAPARVSALLATLAALAASPLASAETTHVVGPGHTLAKISRRYHVSIEALREANNLVPGQKLKPGTRIVIPDDDTPTRSPARTTRQNGASRDEELDSRRDDKTARAAGARGAESYVKRPRNPGSITLVRGSEHWSGKARARGGHLAPGASDAFRRMLRDENSGGSRAIDPRLITLVAQVSDHFGGREIDIVSGYRPHTEGQHTAHSNHNIGRAIDFVVRGVPNEVVRDYCHTLRDVGVGYYPNSSFVHLDVRSASAFWVDESGPGEAPRYTSVTSGSTPAVEALGSKRGGSAKSKTEPQQAAGESGP